MFVSIIIPVLNEEASVKVLLQQLQVYRKQGHEIIVVDGGSDDKTISLSEPLSDKLIKSKAGRAIQMNNGAVHAEHEILWFLHADTLIYDDSVKNILELIKEYDWGRFDIKLSGSHFLFRVIEKMINLRSCITAVATGDQGIFVKREIFNSVGAYPSISLMEDVALSNQLRKISKAVCIKEPLITSSRRWEEKGIIPTVILMWKLRFLYWFGVSAEKLSSQYK